MFAKIVLFFTKKTVATLLASFTSLSAELRKLADESVVKAADYEVKAQALMLKGDAHSAEAEAALHHADKIDSIFKCPAL